VYKNLADLIVENEYLVPGGVIAAHDSKGDYLYLAKIDETLNDEDPLNNAVSTLKRTLKKGEKTVNKELRSLNSLFDATVAANTEKFVSMYMEESLKKEVKFKMMAQKH
jgi:hypothetical protein